MPADSSQLMSTILMVVVMVGAFWFLLLRPAQKKQKTQQEMVSKLAEGARVMTTAGVFGTIVQLGERQAIIELSPGVEMTVLKQAVMRIVEPSEEEFEYDDAGEQASVSEALVPGQTAVDASETPGESGSKTSI